MTASIISLCMYYRKKHFVETYNRKFEAFKLVRNSEKSWKNVSCVLVENRVMTKWCPFTHEQKDVCNDMTVWNLWLAHNLKVYRKVDCYNISYKLKIREIYPWSTATFCKYILSLLNNACYFYPIINW